MRRRFAVLSLLGLIAAWSIPVSSRATDNAAPQFIQSLGNQALQVIRSDLQPPQKLAYFHQMLNQDFDMRGISQFVLGPYWRLANDYERQEFTRLLSDSLVKFYRDRFTRYEGETFRVTGSRFDPAGIIVTSQIIRPNGPPIAVDWRLNTHDGHYKISDVIVDGVSMAATERQAFAGQIQRSGGQVAGLLAKMREQSASY